MRPAGFNSFAVCTSDHAEVVERVARVIRSMDGEMFLRNAPTDANVVEVELEFREVLGVPLLKILAKLTGDVVRQEEPDKNEGSERR